MALKDKKTLLKRWIGIATGKNRVAVKQDVGKCFKVDEVAGYYNDLTGKVNENTLLDANGIPVNEIAGGEKVYFPISIFQYALGLWDLYLLNEQEDFKVHFLRICDWIVSAQRDDGSWDCFSPIGYTTQSVSAMGQGEAISVLVRAEKLCDSGYLESIHKAIEFMLINIKDGGVLRSTENDVILEEYPGNNGEKLSVLNGWIFAVFGLYDYLLIEQNDDVKRLYSSTIHTMVAYLKKYDVGYWSYYDLTGRIASPAYHQLHIALLKVMYQITGIDEFRAYAVKWKGYSENLFSRMKAVAKKVVQKLGDNPEGILVK